MIRETLYAALFARLEATLAGYWCTRDLVPVASCSRWPACILTAGDQTAQQDDHGNAPALWRLEATVALYLQRADAAQPFEPAIHAAIDQVVNALGPQPAESSYGLSYHTTLGDLVERAWVQGAVEIHREPGDQRAVILIPVEMFST